MCAPARKNLTYIFSTSIHQSSFNSQYSTSFTKVPSHIRPPTSTNSNDPRNDWQKLHQRKGSSMQTSPSSMMMSNLWCGRCNRIKLRSTTRYDRPNRGYNMASWYYILQCDSNHMTHWYLDYCQGYFMLSLVLPVSTEKYACWSLSLLLQSCSKIRSPLVYQLRSDKDGALIGNT